MGAMTHARRVSHAILLPVSASALSVLLPNFQIMMVPADATVLSAYTRIMVGVFPRTVPQDTAQGHRAAAGMVANKYGN